MASKAAAILRRTFLIRRAKSLDDLQWVMKMATEVGWGPREKEAECYFSAGLTPYFYIGELKGKRIGCVSLVRHGETMAFVGYRILAKPFREEGYGERLAEFVESLGDKRNIQTMVDMKQKDVTQKRGYHPGWKVTVYQFTASRAVEGLANSQLPPSVEQILPASQADFEKLFGYGADMLGSSQTCKLVLAAWLSHLQESSWVAIGITGEVVGYLIMSKLTRFPEQGYRIAPFYADSSPIARCLLKVAVEFASANNPRHNIVMDVPVDNNPESISIVEKEIGAKPIQECIFFSGKELPTKHLSKVFGIASASIL